jgi:hypothetical protein
MEIGEKIRFDYTGTTQEVILEEGYYQLECWGASGGSYTVANTGVGGYASGELKIDKETTLYVYVGAKGVNSSAPTVNYNFNGGGTAKGSGSSDTRGGGGGATDIRLVGGDWDLEDGLYSRIIVAGGGGGQTYTSSTAYVTGSGGGEVGGNGYNKTITGAIKGYGGTQSSSGQDQNTNADNEAFDYKGDYSTFGKGGSTFTSGYTLSGGGGGWYGGGYGNSAGGGSGYVLTEESFKPEGYTPTSEYYINNPILISGGNDMPSPNGGTFMGTHNTNGLCIITRLSPFGSKTYNYNQIGSNEVTIPNEIKVNDSIVFNITNTEIAKKYDGTMLTYTFPFNCKARLNAYGARGGKGNKATDEQIGKGARASGVFEFKQGDKLLICVGQAGTDTTLSASDGTTGAGGGGTFVVVRTDNETDDTYSGIGVGNEWKVKPLVIGAGGNGSKDIGYNGAGTVYHGLYTSNVTSHINENNSGGSYNSYHNTAYSGKSFLIGAQGATYNYARNGTSYAGFGGGGANKDDGDGGGGGGYWNGTLTRSATSYVSPLALEQDGTDGANFGEGKFIIEFLQIPSVNGKCKIDNEYREIEAMTVKVDNEWRETVATYVKIDNEWKQSIK